MIIVFYESEKNVIHLCTKTGIKILSVQDFRFLSQIPNDEDILYVQDACFVDKKQLQQLFKITENHSSEINRFTGLSETLDDDNSIPTSLHNIVSSHNSSVYGKWLHPTSNGHISLADIKTPKYPNGLGMTGKYDFISVEELGGEAVLEESQFYKIALKKRKIELVDYDYVQKYSGKKKQSSFADKALDAIIIKNSAHGTAEKVAAEGGISVDANGAVEFFVD